MCASRLPFDFHLLQENRNYIITFPNAAKTKSNTHPVPANEMLDWSFPPTNALASEGNDTLFWVFLTLLLESDVLVITRSTAVFSQKHHDYFMRFHVAPKTKFNGAWNNIYFELETKHPNYQENTNSKSRLFWLCRVHLSTSLLLISACWCPCGNVLCVVSALDSNVGGIRQRVMIF